MKQKKVKRIICHIVWLFLIGAFAGFLIETLWYLIKNGKFKSMQGLWYMPLKPIYGLGIIILSYFIKSEIKKQFGYF